MDDIKNDNTNTIHNIVRAAKNTHKNYSKKSNIGQQKFRRDLLPKPADYYEQQLNKYKDNKPLPRNKLYALALCQFHNDHNPSFSVTLKTGAFRCFACGCNGGSVIDFHMKINDCNFTDACKDLGVWDE